MKTIEPKKYFEGKIEKSNYYFSGEDWAAMGKLVLSKIRRGHRDAEIERYFRDNDGLSPTDSALLVKSVRAGFRPDDFKEEVEVSVYENMLRMVKRMILEGKTESFITGELVKEYELTFEQAERAIRTARRSITLKDYSPARGEK